MTYCRTAGKHQIYWTNIYMSAKSWEKVICHLTFYFCNLREVLPAQFSLHGHKCGLKPHALHLICSFRIPYITDVDCTSLAMLLLANPYVKPVVHYSRGDALPVGKLSNFPWYHHSCTLYELKHFLRNKSYSVTTV